MARPRLVLQYGSFSSRVTHAMFCAHIIVHRILTECSTLGCIPTNVSEVEQILHKLWRFGVHRPIPLTLLYDYPPSLAALRSPSNFILKTKVASDAAEVANLAHNYEEYQSFVASCIPDRYSSVDGIDRRLLFIAAVMATAKVLAAQKTLVDEVDIQVYYIDGTLDVVQDTVPAIKIKEF